MVMKREYGTGDDLRKVESKLLPLVNRCLPFLVSNLAFC